MIVEHPNINGSRQLQIRSNDTAGLRIGMAKPAIPTRPRNQFLAALPQEIWLRVAPHIGHALLIQGRALHEAAQPVEQVYFPNGGLISQVVNSGNATQVEAGIVGREGMVGAFEALNETPPTQHAIVQIAGTACRLPAAVFRAEFRRGGLFQEWILRYLQDMNTQTAQCVLCNRLHSVEERLARWILTAHDRTANYEIPVTHKAIAHLLGTRRSSVTVALGIFEVQELLRCARGRLEILDTERLRACSCECYSALHRHQACSAPTSFTA